MSFDFVQGKIKDKHTEPLKMTSTVKGQAMDQQYQNYTSDSICLIQLT